MDHLFTPWRYPIVTVKQPVDGCFLCRAASDPENPEGLVVHQARHHLVMLNRYPYTNGHLLVAPRAHEADPAATSEESQRELWEVVLEARRALQTTYQPDGMNLGMNLGAAGGAGVPDHYHFHLVPRWLGDTNFASVVGGVRVVPEDLESTQRKLRAAFFESRA